MNIWKISIQNLKSKPLYTLLSIFMLSLSIALLLGIEQLKSSFKYQIENNLGNIDMVIGAKGSPLQLVLSSVLHLDNPTGNIPFAEAKKMGKNPLVELAVPISYGDNYKGYRIVGTTPQFMSIYKAEILEGRATQASMEVILGHSVAERLKLGPGDVFLSSHGLVENELDVHDAEFVVVGILKPTQKIIDRLIVTSLESVWDVHDHPDDHHEDHEEEHHEHKEGKEHDHDEHEHGEHEHDEKEDHEHDEGKEITSLLVSFRNPAALLSLPRRINENTNLQAALPKYELNRLYEFTGVGFKTISWIAYAILFISGMTIFINLYRMVKERAFDLALLRTYGASNVQLIKMVSYEGLIIVCLAFLAGYALTKTGLYFLVNYLDSGQVQSILKPLSVDQVIPTLLLVFVMAILSIALAVRPITKMNISTILSNEK